MDGLVCGRYRTTSKLGEGGMAEVWLAQHELIDQQAAIKLLQPHMSVNQEMVRRFLKEAQAAAAIKHPGIVEIYDVGYAADGRAYIVMELLRGEPLNERLKRERQLSVEQSVRLMRQLAGVMDAAHEKRIFHRDLKPENLFVVPDPEVQGGERIKVLDFGLAKLASEFAGSIVTSRGAVFGTPAYMAPEQCQDSGRVDGRADLYSMGCIFYRCLCGRPPFDYKEPLILLQAQLRQIPKAPKERRDDIPSALDALILRLLAKEPELRVQTCSELIAALDDPEISGVARPEDVADTLVFAGGNKPARDAADPEQTTDPQVPDDEHHDAADAHDDAVTLVTVDQSSDGIPVAIPSPLEHHHGETERVAVPAGLLAQPAGPDGASSARGHDVTEDLSPRRPEGRGATAAGEIQVASSPALPVVHHQARAGTAHGQQPATRASSRGAVWVLIVALLVLGGLIVALALM